MQNFATKITIKYQKYFKYNHKQNTSWHLPFCTKQKSSITNGIYALQFIHTFFFMKYIKLKIHD